MVTKSMASHDATTFWLGHTHFHVTLRQKQITRQTSFTHQIFHPQLCVRVLSCTHANRLPKRFQGHRPLNER